MNVESTFGHRLRLRVGGLLVEEHKVLLVNLRSPVTEQIVWMPPGGEVEYGESLKQSLKREFLEETGIKVDVCGLLHVEELIAESFHAVECYFEVSRISGNISVGSDPELAGNEQLIRDVARISIAELAEYQFAPEGLIPKLNDWENRSSFAILSN